MRKHWIWAAACGAAALATHATANEPADKAAYIAPAVMRAAGVDLSGGGFAGADFGAWLERPAGELAFLNGEWQDLLAELHRLGDVSTLTGNGVAMHLATGQYDPIRGDGPHALVLNEGLDLRLFPGRWEFGVAIRPGGADPAGFAFFDASGALVHRVLLTPSSNLDEFDDIVSQFQGEKPAFSPSKEESSPPAPPAPETGAALLEDWRALTDTHDFSRMLNKHQVSRTDALRLAEGEFTARLDLAGYSSLFGTLLEDEISVVLFVLNDGCVQISTGALREVDRSGELLHLVEKDSRTLIALSGVNEAWRVSKPTDHGVMHSLELYGPEGEPVVYIFGARAEDSDTNINKWNDSLFALPVPGGDSGGGLAGTPAAGEAASSEPESAAEPIAALDSGGAIDTFNLPRRVRSQINYIVKRMLAFDKNGDGKLSQDELPGRMEGLVARGSRDGDAFLDEEELTRMAYDQVMKRDAKSEAEAAVARKEKQ
ncbi:MAG: hypothetical protein KF886_22260 [Candidatus Hydrogenedentes bacterium]|nr:hypothetical protein [Candidatus Hydrogenedentota bacterium]